MGTEVLSTTTSKFSVQLARTVLSAVVGLVAGKLFERGFDVVVAKTQDQSAPAEQ